MKIGLISDTHISKKEEKLPYQIKDIFSEIDLILHAGDIYLTSVLDELETCAPVLAVQGNGDITLPDDPRIQNNLVLNCHGYSIGLTHGIDYPEPPWRSLEKAMQYEFGRKVDILIFGDSHVPVLDIYKNVLHINSGSPTFPRQIKELGTVATLEIMPQNKIYAQIISLKNREIIKSINYY